MTDEATQATAENLRADFLNATTTAERWKVLNRAIDWAVVASENAQHYRDASKLARKVAEVEDAEQRIRPGDVVRPSDDGAVDGDNPWVVLSLKGTNLVEIAPLRDDYALHCFLLHASHLKR